MYGDDKCDPSAIRRSIYANQNVRIPIYDIDYFPDAPDISVEDSGAAVLTEVENDENPYYNKRSFRKMMNEDCYESQEFIDSFYPGHENMNRSTKETGKFQDKIIPKKKKCRQVREYGVGGKNLYRHNDRAAFGTVLGFPDMGLSELESRREEFGLEDFPTSEVIFPFEENGSKVYVPDSKGDEIFGKIRNKGGVEVLRAHRGRPGANQKGGNAQMKGGTVGDGRTLPFGSTFIAHYKS